MADTTDLARRLEALRVIVSASREFAPAIKNQVAILINDTLARLAVQQVCASDRNPQGGDADAAPGRSPESAVRRTRPEASGASQAQQPAPAEPAARMLIDDTVRFILCEGVRERLGRGEHALYAAAAAVQPPVVPLTQKDIDEIFDDHAEAPTMTYRYYVARAIEAKVRGIGAVPLSNPALDSNAESVHQERRLDGGVRTDAGGQSGGEAA